MILPIEKDLLHRQFCDRIESINLEAAIALLEALHLAYLKDQAAFVNHVKNEGNKNNG